MTRDMDLDRDLRLAGKLGQLPAPALPAGLAARIVQNATVLPQLGDEPVAAATEQPQTAAPERRARRWLPYSIGGAIAASFVAAVMLQGLDGIAPQMDQARVAQNADAPLPAPLPTVKVFGLASASPAADKEAETVAAVQPKPRRMERVAPASDSPGPSSDGQRAPSAEVAPSQEQAPELASEQNPSVIEKEPTQRAFVGPPAIDDRGAPILQSDPVSGLGISGTGSAPPTAGPPPPGSSRQGPRGGAPRF